MTVTPTHKYLPSASNFELTACLNIGCEVTLINKHWLLKHLPVQKISTMFILLKVREIGAFQHKSIKFAAFLLYFLGRNNAIQLVYASFTYKIHLIENPRANLLIDKNIIFPKSFVINIRGRVCLYKTTK